MIKKRNQPLTKKQTKIKTKQNNNNKKGNDDLKGKNELMIATVLEVWV